MTVGTVILRALVRLFLHVSPVRHIAFIKAVDRHVLDTGLSLVAFRRGARQVDAFIVKMHTIVASSLAYSSFDGENVFDGVRTTVYRLNIVGDADDSDVGPVRQGESIELGKGISKNLSHDTVGDGGGQLHALPITQADGEVLYCMYFHCPVVFLRLFFGN